MISRRRFLQTMGSGLALAPWALSAQPNQTAARKKMAIVSTVWRPSSHAQHMGDRFLVGYPLDGKWHSPGLDVVAVYADQQPEMDLSRQRAEEFGFQLYPSIAETLRCGGSKLAVDGVLIIGEHGDYPRNELGQVQYPRYEFFRDVAQVFRADGRSVPVFNDKHLSWKWEWAKEMVDLSQALDFPFLAGSSLPVTWRMPAIDLPWEAEVDEIMCVAFGGVDSYDFHALEVLQCMAERRRGGETGVAWVEALRGERAWQAFAARSWDKGGWDAGLFEACLCRSQTLTPRATFTHRYPSQAEMREWVADPVVYRCQYADGLKATMMLMNGLVADFTFAARLPGQMEPLSTLFYLPPQPNVHYSAVLMSKVEEMFLTGRAPYRVERTLLTSGILSAAMQGLASGKQVPTPHLAVRYTAEEESLFCRT
jgi:hypothetical protein